MCPCLTSKIKMRQCVTAMCLQGELPSDHHTSPLHPELSLQTLIIPRPTLEVPVWFLSYIQRTVYHWACAVSQKCYSSCYFLSGLTDKVTPFKSVDSWADESTLESHSLSCFLLKEGFLSVLPWRYSKEISNAPYDSVPLWKTVVLPSLLCSMVWSLRKP